MLIFQSILIYGFIIWVMTYFGHIAYKKQYPQGYGGVDMFQRRKMSLTSLFTKSYFLIPIFVFCLFAAIRYKVGVDCESYKESFHDIQIFGETTRAQKIEDAFKLLSDFSSQFTSTHYLLFFLLAMLQIVLYYSCFRKETYVLLFFSLALFLTNEYWSWMNGMRQIIAACAFVASIPLILQKKWLFFTLVAIVASTMHRSALIFLPIGIGAYFCRKSIPNKYVQLVILALCYLMMNSLNDIVYPAIFLFGEQLGYNDAKIEGYSELQMTTIIFGLRSMLLYSAYLIAVIFSDKMKEFYKSEKFNICYNMFFISISLTLLFYNNFTINRIACYFTIFNPAVIAYLFFFLRSNRKQYNYAYMITILLLVVRTLYNFYSVLGDPMETTLYKFDL